MPAGTFDCFVIEGEGYSTGPSGLRNELRITRWMAPDKVRRPIVTENVRKMARNPAAGGRERSSGRLSGGGDKGPAGPASQDRNERLELTSYKQG